MKNIVPWISNSKLKSETMVIHLKMCSRKDPLNREKSRKSVNLLKANKRIIFLCGLRL